MAASSLGDLHAAVPAPAAAAAVVVVSCGCMDMHSLYRLSFELVLVWTCMNYQCLMDLYRLHLGLYALRYLHLEFYGLNVMQIVIYEMIVTFDAIYMNCL